MKEKYTRSWKNLTIHLDFSRWFWKKQSIKSFLLERLTELSNLFYRGLGILLGMWLIIDIVTTQFASIFIIVCIAAWLMFEVKFDFHMKETEK